MEGYTGRRGRFRGDSRRSVIPKDRRFQKHLSSTFKTVQIQFFQLDELIKMSEEEPDDLILSTIKEIKVFASMLNDETIEHKIMASILIIFGKATTSKLQSEVNSMISSISKCKMFFSVHIPKYLASFYQLGLSDNDLASLEMLTELLIKFHHCMPCTAMESASILFPLLENIIKMFSTQHKSLSSLLEKIVETNVKNQEFQQNIKPKEVKYKTAKERLQLQKPPENYRTISILPTPDDIHRPCSFLRPNLTKGEYADAEHYLDVQFRLLREDYIKPLRDGISEYLRLKEEKEAVTRVQDATVHNNVYIVSIDYDEESIIHTAFFDDKNFAKINWKQNKRFINGSLLCFSDDDFKTFYLASVNERKIEELSKGILCLEFENPTEEVLCFSPSRKFVVIETSAYFEAYKHNLTVLSLLDEKKLPMKRYIVKAQKNVYVPAYLKDDDRFDVRTLFKDKNKSNAASIMNRLLQKANIETHLEFENIHIMDDESWPKYSDVNLDPFQLSAIKSALTKEFCVIQGPPGTGKTFVGLKIVELLLANERKWQSGEHSCPILVVCYTNHALDQFLEGLLEFTRNIVRIGGACSSADINNFNLKYLRKQHDVSAEKKHIVEELKINIDMLEKLIKKTDYEILDLNFLSHYLSFHQLQSFENRRKYYEKNTNLMLDWLSHDKNGQGWKTVGKKSKNSIGDILSTTKPLSENEGEKVFNLWKIPIDLRWRLYKMWLNKYLAERNEALHRSKARLKREQEEILEMEMERDVHICRTTKIIGMTTTGAAKNRDLLQRINPKIVIIEEAAEILESHIITSLSPGTEHVILIGDHQQLRPNPTAYLLAVNYDLNISLFERMLKNGIEYNRLNLQHRMRPEIASLLVPHFYKDLQNHESVEKFEHVKGIAKDLFFMTHVHQESNDDSKTRINLFEAKFIAGLYSYLLLQGYDSSQITILTTYTGQMFAIKKELENKRRNMRQHDEKELEKERCNIPPDKKDEAKDVRVTVVDNYQGEENEIILISFVRSNPEGNIGFLKISNRVCVALSRAKRGFYAIGNFEFLANKSELWKKVTDKLKEQDAIGPSLQLKCQNHPDTSEVVADEGDFNSVSDGGCTRDCEFRLECGHQCSLKCHPYDREHIEIECHKPCIKHCIRGHLCPKQCYQNCGDCFSMVEKVVDVCGHETEVFCYRKLKEAVCPELCPYFFRCLYNESKVEGMLDNVFFVSCNLNDPSMSNFMERLQKYLVLQGYKEHEILILSGMDSKLTRIAEHVVLVLAVFPDCLDKNEFLVASSEIFVTISRAKKGLFCIGNFDLFAKNFKFWQSVTNVLKTKCKLGPNLTLQCQNHPDMHQIISSSKDFDSVKEGGCTKQCEFQLHCGHTCPLKCHPYDKKHSKVKCLEPCARNCDYGHLCSKRCWEECECTEIVDKKIECGHIERVECNLRNDYKECSQSCERFLPCGHKCTKLCRTSCGTGKCNEPITVKLPECQHDYPILCWMQSSLTYFCNLCEEPCRTVLSCGHVCEGTCGSCSNGRLHIKCKKPCRSVLICGHKCPALCFESCPPCNYRCQRRCKHGVCRKLCREPCDPCTKPCEWKCPHKKCNNLCGEKCDRPPCDEPCSVLLRCGHPCIGLCGEPCVKKCRTCDEYLVMKACHGTDLLPNSRFVSLENCGHFFEVSELAKWIIQSPGDNAVHSKKCPGCSRTIFHNLRFGNVVKTNIENIELVKKKTSGDESYNQKLKLNLIGASKQCKMYKLRNGIEKKCLYPNRSIQDLTVLENFVSIFLNFDSVFSDETHTYDFQNKYESNIFNPTKDLELCNNLQAYVKKAREWMTNFVLENSFQASKEQLREFALEAYRVALMNNLLKSLDSIPKLTFDASLQLYELMNSLLTIIPFRAEDAEKLHSTYEEFLILISAPECKKVKIPALKSVSSSSGTWFICHKGHVFSSITCLKTSEVKSCYECDPSIALVPSFNEVSQTVKRKPSMMEMLERIRLNRSTPNRSKPSIGKTGTLRLRR